MASKKGKFREAFEKRYGKKATKKADGDMSHKEGGTHMMPDGHMMSDADMKKRMKK